MADINDTLRVFPSLGALVDHASGPSRMSLDNRGSRAESGRSWFGTASWEEMLTVVHRWDDGAKDVERMRVAIMTGAEKSRVKRVQSPTPPGTIDIAGIISGDPGAGFTQRRRTTQTTKQRGKVIRVALNVCCAGGVTADTIKRRGAAVLALVDMLQDRGLRVEIIGLMATGSRTSSAIWECRWTVKRADQKVSLASLAFGLAHPSMLRRVMFSAMEVESSEIRKRHGVSIKGGYGRVVESSLRERLTAEGGIYLDGMQSDVHFKDDDSAREWVRAQVERIMSGR